MYDGHHEFGFFLADWRPCQSLTRRVKTREASSWKSLAKFKVAEWDSGMRGIGFVPPMPPVCPRTSFCPVLCVNQRSKLSSTYHFSSVDPRTTRDLLLHSWKLAMKIASLDERPTFTWGNRSLVHKLIKDDCLSLMPSLSHSKLPRKRHLHPRWWWSLSRSLLLYLDLLFLPRIQVHLPSRCPIKLNVRKIRPFKPANCTVVKKNKVMGMIYLSLILPDRLRTHLQAVERVYHMFRYFENCISTISTI